MPADSLRDAAFCDVLNRELVCALGCTEPIAVAYAAALASQTLRLRARSYGCCLLGQHHQKREERDRA